MERNQTNHGKIHSICRHRFPVDVLLIERNINTRFSLKAALSIDGPASLVEIELGSIIFIDRNIRESLQRFIPILEVHRFWWGRR